jgi:profilin
MTNTKQIKPEEMKNIAAVLAGEGKGPAVDKAFADGIHVAGERYVAFNVQGRHLYGRKGKTGIIIVKTKQAVLVSHYGEAVVAPGNAVTTVEALADYLEKAGY